MTQHTPGPWTYKPWTYNNAKRTVVAICTEEDAIAHTFHLWRDGNSDAEEVSANARLIASAPELLAQVERYRSIAKNLIAREAMSDKDFQDLKSALSFVAPETDRVLAKATGD